MPTRRSGRRSSRRCTRRPPSRPARANVPPALVVAAVRADFLGRLIAYPPLKAALDAGPFTVGPMSEAELRLAVTGPAAEAGLAVEPALVEAVIAELREADLSGGLGSGVLPLMSQAMAATWEHREGSELTLRGYRRAGGVADAVNRGAQAAYDALTGPQQGRGPPGVHPAHRRSRRMASSRGAGAAGPICAPREPQMAADIDAVIDVFSARRLLVLGQDSVEISHDVLLQAWKQLRDWLGDDQLDRALYSQVVTDADTWDSQRPGLRPTCTGRGGWPPSTPPPPAGRTRPPATPRYPPPARRSCAPLTTPRVAAPGGGAA